MDRDESATRSPTTPVVAEPRTNSIVIDDNASPEDLLCLQSAIDEAQVDAQRIRELQASEVKAPAANTPLRDALAQIETLKRSASAVRARLEAEAQTAKRRAEQAHEALAGRTAELDDLRIAKADLTTALEATQSRLADLETESSVHQAEVDRLQRERAADNERISALESELQRLRNTPSTSSHTAADTAHATVDTPDSRLQLLKEQLAAAEGARAEARRELEAANAAHADEINAWHVAAAEREAELVAARDELARRLEDEQSQTCIAQEDAAALAARLRTADTDVVALTQQCQALEEELVALREEREREREVFEATARQREDEYHHTIQEKEAVVRAAQAEAAERIAALETERDAALQLSEEVEGKLAATLADQRTLQTESQAERQSERSTLTTRIAALEEDIRQRDARLDRLAAETDQLRQRAAEAARAREEQWCSTRAELDQQIAALQHAAAQSQSALGTEHTRIRTLEDQVASQSAALDNARSQLDTASAAAREQAIALASAEQRASTLQRDNDELMHGVEGLEARRSEAIREQEHTTTRMHELDAECRELRMRVDEMTVLTGQLERECDRLRRERLASEDARKFKADHARLESKITEIEHQHSEAVQRHSAAVGGYMVELNQRSEALQAAEVELQRTTEELNLTRQACEDAVAQLAAGRVERNELEQQLAELRAAAASGTARSAAEPARPQAPSPSTARPVAAARADVRSAPAKPAPAATAPSGISGPLTLIHLEENTTLRERVREVVGRLPDSRYLNTLEFDRTPAPGTRMLAVNLLNRAHDPLAAIAASVTADADHDTVFAYCADGSYGFSFGPVNFFPQPLDPGGCVARLLEWRGSIQRLLAMSENIEMASTLREVLARIRCSTSVALDLRQVLDLLPMIDPDIVLVDLALPRGEGLRLISRLRADPKTRDLALAVLLPSPASVAEFRQQALRAARESSLSAAELAQALSGRLGATERTDPKSKDPGLAQAS